ncbi:MAG: SRPBCC domain-containing protein [Planctomycetes bacterium]|nr:SRPBCC domain-containing protein [Planctomycetota bacterium]
MLTRRLATAIDIEAPPAAVWQVLTGLADYPAWNPFVVAVDDHPDGQRTVLTIAPPGMRRQRHAVRITACEPLRRFAWQGDFLEAGVLLIGRHSLLLSPLADGRTRLDHVEEFTGLLVPLVWRWVLDTRLRAGFHAMDAACAARAKQAAGGAAAQLTGPSRRCASSR